MDRPLNKDEIVMYKQIKSHAAAIKASREVLGRDIHDYKNCELCSHELLGKYVRKRLDDGQRCKSGVSYANG